MDAQGKCQGSHKKTSGNDQNYCPASGPACFLGSYPSKDSPCCSHNLTFANISDFSAFLPKNATGCSSRTVIPILNGLCLGNRSCTILVDDSVLNRWKRVSDWGNSCPDSPHMVWMQNNTPYCESRFSDDADFSNCPDSNMRGLIITAQCYTTKIDISKNWAFRIMGWDYVTRRYFVTMACGLDIIYCLIFLIVVIWMKKQEKSAVARITDERLTVQNYTVQLINLPRHTDVLNLGKDLKSHLEGVLSSKPPVFNTELREIKIAEINFGLTNAVQAS